MDAHALRMRASMTAGASLPSNIFTRALACEGEGQGEGEGEGEGGSEGQDEGKGEDEGESQESTSGDACSFALLVDERAWRGKIAKLQQKEVCSRCV